MIEIRPLNNHEEALEVCLRANDYFQLVSGKAVTLANIKKIFTAVPPTKTLQDKFIFGIYDCGKLVGLMDVIKNYPENATWWLGLFLIAEESRGKGLGKLAHQQLIQYSKSEGAKAIQLGVVEKNFKAVPFWKDLGYTTKQIQITDEQQIKVMELLI